MERNNFYFRLYSFTLSALFYLNLIIKLPWMLIKLAEVFLESLQTGLKQQSISNNDKKEMELS